eukprot:m.3313 g.3313  ORF g.3313 m.3313 type:complete len:508 (+) comp2735_c0_seq1:183-1706(+)
MSKENGVAFTDKDFLISKICEAANSARLHQHQCLLLKTLALPFSEDTSPSAGGDETSSISSLALVALQSALNVCKTSSQWPSPWDTLKFSEVATRLYDETVIMRTDDRTQEEHELRGLFVDRQHLLQVLEEARQEDVNLVGSFAPKKTLQSSVPKVKSSKKVNGRGTVSVSFDANLWETVVSYTGVIKSSGNKIRAGKVGKKDAQPLSAVYEGLYLSKPVVIKSVLLRRGIKGKKLFEREMKRLGSLSHPNVCNILGGYIVPSGTTMSRGVIVMERLDVSLFSALHTCTHGLGLREKIGIMMDVASGLLYLHSCGIYHGNVHTKNVMLNTSQVSKGVVAKLIGNIGLESCLPKNEYIFVDDEAAMLDDYRYKPLETMNNYKKQKSPTIPIKRINSGDSIDNGDCNEERGDVYSFGLLLWELYAEQIPYHEAKSMSALKEAKIHNSNCNSLPFPSSTLHCLVADCLEPFAELRPSFIQVYQQLYGELEEDEAGEWAKHEHEDGVKSWV